MPRNQASNNGALNRRKLPPGREPARIIHSSAHYLSFADYIERQIIHGIFRFFISRINICCLIEAVVCRQPSVPIDPASLERQLSIYQ